MNNENQSKTELEVVEPIGLGVLVIPEEYIHWGGFVISSLMVIVSMLLLDYKGTNASGELTPTGYIDLVLLFLFFISTTRCAYLYVKSWFFSMKVDDNNDDDDEKEDNNIPPSGSGRLMFHP